MLTITPRSSGFDPVAAGSLLSKMLRRCCHRTNWLHMDIMKLVSAALTTILMVLLFHLQDGHFVPNLTIGPPVIESLRKHTNAYLDCHLMVTNPMAKAGASGFTFHVEVAKENWQQLVEKIKSAGMRPAVALKPGTPVELVYPLLCVEGTTPVEMVLVMTVEPGFGGHKFMPNMMDKVRALRHKYPTLDIQVDGGLGPSTIDTAAAAGANCIVAGSSVFGAPEPGDVISLLRTSVEKAQPTT
ncbi:unnamed protein product [Arabidopsis halleri]